MAKRSHVLLATLGGQPQVVTFTLDLLLKQYPIKHVIVLHPKPSQERLQKSLECLRREFIGDRYGSPNNVISFRSHILEMDGESIDDIVDDEHADVTLNSIHTLIRDLKQQGHRIHLSVSGGRRMMSLLAISVANMHFDRHDAIWHIHTSEAIKERAHNGKLMHVSDDGQVSLIRAPFLSLGAYISSESNSFRKEQDVQRSRLEEQERVRCQIVLEQAKPRQRDVLKAYAQGWHTSKVASELCLTEATVHTHKSNLLQLCRTVWSIEEKEPLSYHFIHNKFASFFGDQE